MVSAWAPLGEGSEDERAMTRRTQIKHVAGKLFMQKGVAGASIRDIADGVGISPGSLYHHFPSKEAIAFAILDDFITDLSARYGSVLPHVTGTREEIRALFRTSVEIAATHPYATEIYQNELAYHGPMAPERIADGVRRANQFWLDTAMRAQDSGQLRPMIDPAEFARMLRESAWWSVRHHRDALAERAGAIVDTLVTVFVDGAVSPEPAPGMAGSTDQNGIEKRLAALEARIADLEKLEKQPWGAPRLPDASADAASAAPIVKPSAQDLSNDTQPDER